MLRSKAAHEQAAQNLAQHGDMPAILLNDAGIYGTYLMHQGDPSQKYPMMAIIEQGCGLLSESVYGFWHFSQDSAVAVVFDRSCSSLEKLCRL